MHKTILITGASDGIGKLTAKHLTEQGHNVMIHGRNELKTAQVAQELGGLPYYIADLSVPADIDKMADAVLEAHQNLDVLINNAGVLKTSHTIAACGLDVRFMVNMIAPYMLTQRLLPIIPRHGRVVNLSSAAQERIHLPNMEGKRPSADMSAYAQSKLGITLWSIELAKTLEHGPAIIAVNPGSLLASKMVVEGFGVPGKDLTIGATILCQAALDDSFANASGQYFDNDSGQFRPPHSAALDTKHRDDVMQSMRNIIAAL